MKTILLIGAAGVVLALLFTACAAAMPPGPMPEKVLPLTGGPYKIAAGGPVQVITIAENGANTAVLSGGANALNRIRFTVDEAAREIRVQMEFPGSWNFRGDVALTVGAPVDSIDISGSVSVDYRDATVSTFKLDASGSSKGNYSFTGDLKTLNVKTGGSGRDSFAFAKPLDSLEVRASGSSDFTFSGSVKQAEYNLGGSATIRAFDLAAQEVTVRSAGSCEIEQGFAPEGKLGGSMSGSGKIIHTGNPAVDVKTSGSVRISPR